jgi:hypothetical protein
MIKTLNVEISGFVKRKTVIAMRGSAISVSLLPVILKATQSKIPEPELSSVQW